MTRFAALEGSRGLFFGLGDIQPMNLEKIGTKFDLTREGVREVKERPARRLGASARNKALKSYLV